MSKPTETPAAGSGGAPAAPAAGGQGQDGDDQMFQLLYAAASEAPAKSEEGDPADTPAGDTLLGAISKPSDGPKGGDADADAKKKAEEEAAAKKKAEDEAAAQKKAEEDAAAAEAALDPVRVRRKPAPPPTAPAAAAAPAAPKAEEKTDQQKWEESLLDEERDQLELARFAEKDNPSKYAGFAAKTEKYLKEHAAYLEKNPGATEPGSDAAAAYEQWLQKHKPSLSPAEGRRLEVRREANRIADEKLAASKTEIEALHEETFRRDAEPKAKSEADAFFRDAADFAMPEDLAKLAKEKGLAEAKKAFPMEYRIAGEVLSDAADQVEELIRITTKNPRTNRPLVAYDPNNKKHAAILTFINTQCNAFKNGVPGEPPAQRATRLRAQIRDGKRFATRIEYYSMPEDQRAPYWTFSREDLISMKRFEAKHTIASRIEAETKRLEAEGFVRRRPESAAAPGPSGGGAPPAPRPGQIPAGDGAAPSGGAMEREMNLIYGAGE